MKFNGSRDLEFRLDTAVIKNVARYIESAKPEQISTTTIDGQEVVAVALSEQMAKAEALTRLSV